MAERLHQEDFMSVREAATIAGVSPDTIRNWVSQGSLKAYRKILITWVDLLTMMNTPSPYTEDSIEDQAA